jgi:hypothetical protein
MRGGPPFVAFDQNEPDALAPKFGLELGALGGGGV